MLAGEILRKEREAAGLSRGELRLRILRYFEKAPSLSAIRDLENGESKAPQRRNWVKYRKVLVTLSDLTVI